MGKKAAIAVAHGDGIGPEIMAAVLHVLQAAGAQIDIHPVEVGEKIYLEGHQAGIRPETWDVLRQTEAFLKAPITTPQGGGFKSINVTIRTLMGLYANVRPCVSYHPYVRTKHPVMDLVIVRENEEDLYTGIEYRQTQDSVQALKIMTRSGCERIVRYAFQYAIENKRKKVTCFTKDNILKISDGLFHQVFDEVGKEFPQLEKEHWIIDIGAAKMADTPEAFDVIVMPNLYGDILSDVAAQIAGSVGLAGSANIGVHGAMFEAIHGSAPRRAGQNLANPSGLLLASVMMMAYVNQPDVATLIHNAWLKTLEEGVHTYDIYKEGISKQKVGTKEFAEAVVERLGQKPSKLRESTYGAGAGRQALSVKEKSAISQSKALVGVDVFVEANSSVAELQKKMVHYDNGQLILTMMTNRGAKVWPDTIAETTLCDQWRCRYQRPDGTPISPQDIVGLLQKFVKDGIDFIQIENLYTFDGVPGFSHALVKKIELSATKTP